MGFGVRVLGIDSVQGRVFVASPLPVHFFQAGSDFRFASTLALLPAQFKRLSNFYLFIFYYYT